MSDMAQEVVDKVLARVELADRLRAARREERLRIARELHDRVAHGMAVAAQNLELHRQYAGRDATRARAKLAAAAAALDDSLRTVQQLAAELRRPVGGAGVAHALRAYLRSAVPATVLVRLQVSGDIRALLPDLGEELYMIMREATWNAVRHADATELRLTIAVTGATVTATVTDNGRGFETGTATAGCGLLTMAERAHLVRGVLKVDSAPGTGTTVTFEGPAG